MRLSSRVILVTSIVLAVFIVVLVIVTRLHLPWLWPSAKWPDFWIALVSGVITLATIGALATFIVERILKDIEERRSEEQFQAECKKDWAEFEQRLYYRFTEESAFSSDIDYADMAIPHDAVVLAKLLETAPLSRWQQGLKSPALLFTYIKFFDSDYSNFKENANHLLQHLKSKIDEYNQTLASSGQEDAQLIFCLRLILEDSAVNKDIDAAKIDNPSAASLSLVVESSSFLVAELSIEISVSRKLPQIC